MAAIDPSLLKDREAFKKRSRATPVVEKKVSKAKVTADSRPSASKPKKKKKASQFSRPKPNILHTGTSDSIKEAAKHGHRGKNPARILKAVVDMMKERYLTKVYDPLSIDEILKEIDLEELHSEIKQRLYEELRRNRKIRYYSEADRFIFLPSLGHQVRSKTQLLAFLQDRESKGMGGVSITDLKEAIPQTEKVLRKLEKDIFRLKCGERDKNEEVVFYNNHDYDITVDESIVSQWRQVSVDGQSERDIEKYLENVGLGAMQGETRKRKAPTQQRKTSKKSRQTKILNTHLETDLLKEYSEDGTQLTTPT
ncbi:PREDICTED: transcription initiation factor IIE subunit beta-like [Amphimedon queenslandica]|uniref:Transcription initiation factor IIE subunit beta n=1 Tax=Amphimedon queenslandica TaxID=400682 RepID=A0A1X7VMZ9_AMPQE|nr:PREDICTED: transcription initiation factor IIE subunit beta-like [Amphimedon queenslandica]|eukprot:XP_003383616.1 PREDICTED: transcription initiation factor IIE subunit beta-like [Amphimedon queenslandica]